MLRSAQHDRQEVSELEELVEYSANAAVMSEAAGDCFAGFLRSLRLIEQRR